MSKAFTKEDEDAPEPKLVRIGVPVPSPNYLTAAGERTLRAELSGLGTGDEARAQAISEHLATATVIGVPADTSRVAFGATVTVEDAAGKRTTYRLVGAIEAMPREGAIYWMSPIGEALHDAEVGDSITLPKGDVEVVAIDY